MDKIMASMQPDYRTATSRHSRKRLRAEGVLRYLSAATDAVLGGSIRMADAALEPMLSIVFLDALRVKIRDAESRSVQEQAVYVALGVTPRANVRFLGPMGLPNMKGGKNSGSRLMTICAPGGRES